MPDKDPSVWGFVAAAAVGVVGGILRLIRESKGGVLTRANIRNLAIDGFSSGFITVMIYGVLFYGMGWHPVASVFVGGIVAHLGTREIILLLERYLVNRRA